MCSAKYWSVVKYDLSDPQYTAAFNRWYNEIHVPEVLERSGFERAWRTQEARDLPGAGSPEQEYWAIYEIDTPERFRKAAGDRGKRSESDQEFAAAMVNWGRVFYSIEASIGHASDSPVRVWWREDIDGPDDAAAQEEFLPYIRDSYLPSRLAASGACRAWQLIRFADDLQVGAPAPGQYMNIFEYGAATIPDGLELSADWEGHRVMRRASHVSRVLLELTAADASP
jgi:hypothetical protein